MLFRLSFVAASFTRHAIKEHKPFNTFQHWNEITLSKQYNETLRNGRTMTEKETREIYIYIRYDSFLKSFPCD